MTDLADLFELYGNVTFPAEIFGKNVGVDKAKVIFGQVNRLKTTGD